MALSLLTSILIVWLYVGRNIVRRLTALNDGMLAIAGGSLHAPVAAQGADEIAAMGRAVEVFRKNTLERDELLAEKAEAADRLEKQVKERTAELSASLQQQTATADVLKVISRSTFNLQLVLEALIESATRLCAATRGHIFRFDGEFLRFAASYGAWPGFTEYLERHPLRPGAGSIAGRAASERRTIHCHDVLQEAGYELSDLWKQQGYRTVLAVPMLREATLLGVITDSEDKC